MVVTFRDHIASLLYAKSLSFKLDDNELGAVTLMSTDIDRLITSLTALTQIWGHIASVAIGTWLLWRQLDIVALAPWCIVGLCSIAQAGIARSMPKRQSTWVNPVQRRIGLTSKFATRNQIRKASRYDRYNG
jgi:ATP-binding cassette subfamily C (CFTR/MRP) protein 1